MKSVVIRGDGIAASCCAHLLMKAGIPVSVERPDRPRLPVIMLSGAALALMGDVFGDLGALAGLPQIRKRVVAWGPNATPVAVSHAAVVVSEKVLLESISKQDSDSVTREPGLRRVPRIVRDWTVLAAPPLPEETVEHHFGSRKATAVAVEMKDGVEANACWVESLQNGWLFLIPNGAWNAYLLCVGDKVETLLGESRLIAKQIERVGKPAGEFPAHPRVQWPLCGSGWLACGTAAMAFDPLCGDGTAHAIREAILAAAVIQAMAKGADVEPLLAHYQARLTAGLARHILLCEQFYQTGHQGSWWESELQLMKKGAEWCTRRVGNLAKFQYQLSGFELRPVA